MCMSVIRQLDPAYEMLPRVREPLLVRWLRWHRFGMARRWRWRPRWSGGWNRRPSFGGMAWIEWLCFALRRDVGGFAWGPMRVQHRETGKIREI